MESKRLKAPIQMTLDQPWAGLLSPSPDREAETEWTETRESPEGSCLIYRASTDWVLHSVLCAREHQWSYVDWMDGWMSGHRWIRKQTDETEEQNRHPLPAKAPEERSSSSLSRGLTWPTQYLPPEAVGARDEQPGRSKLFLCQEVLPLSRTLRGLTSETLLHSHGGRPEKPTHQLVKLTAALYRICWRSWQTGHMACRPEAQSGSWHGWGTWPAGLDQGCLPW